MNGKAVRNTVLISFVSALMLTFAVQPAVCLQTSFTTTENVDISFVPSPVYTREEANPDLIDKGSGQETEMEFKYVEDDKTLGDDYEKVIIRQKGSDDDDISARSSTFDISLTVPKDKDFTFGITLSNHLFFEQQQQHYDIDYRPFQRIRQGFCGKESHSQLSVMGRIDEICQK